VLQKTSDDVQLLLFAFQRAQEVSAERQRTVIQGLRLAVYKDQTPSSSCVFMHPLLTQAIPNDVLSFSANDAVDPTALRELELLEEQLLLHEIAYEESLIRESIAELGEIETSIVELFREQGHMIGATTRTLRRNRKLNSYPM
jgi:hypothetical protein